MLKSDLILNHNLDEDISIITELISALRKEGISTQIKDLEKELKDSDTENCTEKLREKILNFAMFNGKPLDTLKNNFNKILNQQAIEIISIAINRISDFNSKYYDNISDKISNLKRGELLNILSQYYNTLLNVFSDLQSVKYYLIEHKKMTKKILPSSNNYYLIFSNIKSNKLSIIEQYDVIKFVIDVLKTIEPSFEDMIKLDFDTGSPQLEFSFNIDFFPKLSKNILKIFESFKKPSFKIFFNQFNKFKREKYKEIRKKITELKKIEKEGSISEKESAEQKKILYNKLIDPEGTEEEKLREKYILMANAYKNINSREINMTTRELFLN